MIRRFFEVCYIIIQQNDLLPPVVIRRFFEVCYIHHQHQSHHDHVVI